MQYLALTFHSGLKINGKEHDLPANCPLQAKMIWRGTLQDFPAALGSLFLCSWFGNIPSSSKVNCNVLISKVAKVGQSQTWEVCKYAEKY